MATVDRYEQLVTLEYLDNLVHLRPCDYGPTVASFLEGRAIELGIPCPQAVPCTKSPEGDDSRKTDWRATLDTIRRRRSELRGARPSPIERNIRAIARAFDLDAVDRALLGLLVRCQCAGPVESLAYELARSLPGRSDAAGFFFAIPAMLGLSRTGIGRRLESRGSLASSGLVRVNPDGEILPFRGLIHVILTGTLTKDNVRDRLLGKPVSPDLEWEDFDHVAADRDHIADVLAQATAKAAKGIHILVYGPVGTGKTEFCKTVAARIALPLLSVGEADESGLEPERYERIASYCMAQRLLQPLGGALVLFDEMEDLLLGSSVRRMSGGEPVFNAGSKVFLNRLLEGTGVPTLWTANNVSQIPPAILRRMTHALQLNVPPIRVRARIWKRTIDREGLAVSEDEVVALAREFEAPPSLAASAVKSAALTQGGVSRMRRCVSGIAKALNGGIEPIPPMVPDVPIAPELFDADVDLRGLADLLAAADGRRAFSLCLYGPPGTGKSAYARYLADRMSMEVLQKRTSDLLSMWVGETEKNIARAFEEARSAGAFLVFDEADSLLQDRRGAIRSWEVTQVNEMLARMESHDLPFACTTNLFEHLDEASLRRFTFKVELRFLTPDQAAAAFRLFFGLEPPASLFSVPTMTPGDFAVVAKRASVIGIGGNPDELVAMLAQEAARKRGRARPIGFRSIASGPVVAS